MFPFGEHVINKYVAWCLILHACNRNLSSTTFTNAATSTSPLPKDFDVLKLENRVFLTNEPTYQNQNPEKWAENAPERLSHGVLRFLVFASSTVYHGDIQTLHRLLRRGEVEVGRRLAGLAEDSKTTTSLTIQSLPPKNRKKSLDIQRHIKTQEVFGGMEKKTLSFSDGFLVPLYRRLDKAKARYTVCEGGNALKPPQTPKALGYSRNKQESAQQTHLTKRTNTKQKITPA